MRRAYFIMRVLAYILVLAGMALFMGGKRWLSLDSPWIAVGGAMLMVGFAAFFISYMLYAWMRIRRCLPRSTTDDAPPP